MANTTNLDLIKPAGTDRALVAQINSNSDKIDLFAGKMIDESVYYGTSTTEAGTQQKDVTAANFPSSLKAGQKLTVKFSNGQTYNGQPTLKVNNLAAKNICRFGSTAAARYEWNAGEVINLIYDGTNWIIVGGGIAGTTYYGKTKLTSALDSESEALALTAKAGKLLNENKQGKIQTATTTNTSAAAYGDITWTALKNKTVLAVHVHPTSDGDSAWHPVIWSFEPTTGRLTYQRFDLGTGVRASVANINMTIKVWYV